jgi:serine protease AprX
VAIFAGLLPGSIARSSPASTSWLDRGAHDHRVHAAIVANPHKLPAEYMANLRHVHEDGTIRVMVALARRTEAVETFVRTRTSNLNWYGDDPRFYASVDQDGFAALLESDAVTFVEPDYPLSYFLTTSVPDVNGRGDRGVWRFEPDEGLGRLSSGVPGLEVDAVTGKGVTVAVVDSGIDKTHRDFGGWDCDPGFYAPCESRIVKAVVIDQLTGSGENDPGDSMPTTEVASGHGTHVAGIVAGNGYYARDGEASPGVYGGDGYVIGMAPQASLVSVKVGDGPSAALGSDALQWALDHAGELGIRVTNNSWGCLSGCAYSPESVLAQIQRDLYEAGVVTVFAAGNGGGEGSGDEFSGRSQSPYVLSVASYDDETGELSSFSSRGSRSSALVDPNVWTPQDEGAGPPRRPDIAAPGYFIDSAASLTGGAASLIPRVDPADADQKPGFLAYTFMSGTSMAAPHVTGAAALLIGACPTARPLDVMRALMAGAARAKIHKTDGSAVAEPFEVGYGGLDVRASLEWLLPRPPCNGTGLGRLEGTVIEAGSEEPIENARLACSGSIAAITDPDGLYAIDDVPAATYTCKVSAKGFKTVRKQVEIKHATTSVLDLTLKKPKSRRGAA